MRCRDADRAAAADRKGDQRGIVDGDKVFPALLQLPGAARVQLRKADLRQAAAHGLDGMKGGRAFLQEGNEL